MGLDRRAFLKTTAGTVAACWLTSGLSRQIFAAERETVPSPYYPLAPLQPWVQNYQPPSGLFNAKTAQTLKYDWQFRGSEKQKANAANIAIQRQPSSSGIKYEISQLRDGRQLTAKISCQADDFETVQDWSLEETAAHGYRKEDGPITHVTKLTSQTTGHVDGANVHLTRSGREMIIPIEGPLLCSWVLMINPQIVQHLSDSKSKFTLADQMSVLRPGHTIRPDIKIPIPATATEANCATYLITGRGTPPTHLVIHPQTGTLFMTCFQESAILTSIDNAS